MDESEKIDIPEDKIKETVPVPRDNPFRVMSALFHESVGKLPAHLVILFVVAAMAAVLAGIFMKFESAQAEDRNAYLVARIVPEASRPVLTEAQLRGVWAVESGDFITVLKMGSGIFEMVTRPKDNPVTRYFIRGGYRSDGNVLILQTRADLGSPYDSDHPEYKFTPISFRDMNTRVQLRGNMMVWEVPESEKKRLNYNDSALMSVVESPSPWVKISNTP